MSIEFDPGSTEFNKARALGDALIEVNPTDTQQHWAESAKALLAALLAAESNEGDVGTSLSEQLAQANGLSSDGYNPLAVLDPNEDEFFDRAALLADAIVEIE
jgi:hypothetical protein